MFAYNTVIVLLGTALLGANAGLVGSFAVLRRRALTGDALAHAALPGLCLAFLLIGHRNLPALLAGALVTGVLGVLVISTLRQGTRIKEDAAIGIVLSVFFGAGIVLSQIIQKRTSEGSKAGLDSYILGKTAGIILQDVVLLGGVSLISLILIMLLYKEFKLIVFDPDFARVQGWPVVRLDVLLMALIALAVVFGLPAVGVVLMAALLILPGASARFWTDRLGLMLGLAAGFGLLTGLVGTVISANHAGFPAGPIIVLVATVGFLISVLFAPRRGALARVLARRRFRHELDQRNLLRLLYDLAEPRLPTLAPIDLDEILPLKSWSRSRLDTLVAQAAQDGFLQRLLDGSVQLTDVGLHRASELAREHRLWERFLLDHPDQATSLADLAVDSVDDLLPPNLIDDLESQLATEGRLPRAVGRESKGEN